MAFKGLRLLLCEVNNKVHGAFLCCYLCRVLSFDGRLMHVFSWYYVCVISACNGTLADLWSRSLADVIDYDFMMVSIRESAKRSRRKTQSHLTDLEQKVDAAALAEFLSWLEEEINKHVRVTEVEVADKLHELCTSLAGFINDSLDTTSGTGAIRAIIHYKEKANSFNLFTSMNLNMFTIVTLNLFTPFVNPCTFLDQLDDLCLTGMMASQL